ncbi:protease inhibitor HPI-like [Miscanthus floridulus]|uniref:protease inhibitor HPI-like n=1 Tax=Miscanthus floridulus TaxID=154761 RepID=UPI003457D78B
MRSSTKAMGRRLPAAAGSTDDDGGKLKSSWPEMVGKHMVEAAAIIKSERQDVILEFHTADDPQPPDFDAHRVCLFLDEDLIVVRTPVVG